MSHEIRTPLNALSGFSSILTDSNIDTEIRKQCNDIIQQNSDLLLKLIDDVVDLSSLERGKMQFHFGIHDAIFLCQNVIDTVDKIKQTAATVTFQTSLKKLELYTDEARLQQLLINLLINATKFTTEGSITLTLDMQDNMALFSVTDTGCGIAPEKQDKIFNRFEKLDENAQGSGLGLSICQLIVEHFGGKFGLTLITRMVHGLYLRTLSNLPPSIIKRRKHNEKITIHTVLYPANIFRLEQRLYVINY